MKIEVLTDSGYEQFSGKVEDYVVSEIDQLNSAEEMVADTQRTIGRLLDVLASKGILSAREIAFIASGYESDAYFLNTSFKDLG